MCSGHNFFSKVISILLVLSGCVLFHGYAELGKELKVQGQDYKSFVLDVANKELTSDLDDEHELGRSGIRHLIEKTTKLYDQGTFFELVGLLHAKLVLEQEIEGAWLEIVLESPKKIRINYKNEPYVLHSVEFDVITQDFVIECKSALDTSCVKVDQFIKEAAMLDWLGQIRDEWNNKNFKKDIINKNGRVLLVICGTCTGGRDVKLFSSWTNQNSSKTKCLKSWHDLISNLAQKQVFGFFEHGVLSGLQEKLYELHFPYEDCINLVKDLVGESNPGVPGDDDWNTDLENYYNTAETCRSPRGEPNEKLCLSGYLPEWKQEYASVLLACLCLGLGV